MNNHLTPNTLVSKRENLYFTILALIATAIWLAIVISLIGIVYALFFTAFIWFANGLFIARIRSDSVEANNLQFPELYKTFCEVCKKLELSTVPRIFILQSEGALNAFATRHSGRDFVVVFSSLYEGLGSGTDEMRFLLGHEIGHIKRKHILRRMFLTPSLWIPLLGVAYNRSIEETCDRFGTFAAGNARAAARALVILSAGSQPGKEADTKKFAEQYNQERGFFISWHELTSTYPTLAQRTHHVLSLDERTYPVRASRHPLGYLFALLFSRSTLAILLFVYMAIMAVGGIKAAKEKTSSAKNIAKSQQNYDDQYDYKK